MSLFNHTQTVNFANKTVMNPIKIIQGEAKARTIHFKLVDGGTVVDLTGCTVRAYILPFGATTPLYEDLTIVSAVKGTCDYVVSGNAAATAGDAVLQIEVIASGSPDPLATGYSKEIPLQVTARKDFTGALESSTVFSALLNALSLAQSLDGNALHKTGDETATGIKTLNLKFGADADANSKKITALGAPAANTDAANKLYVDQNINFAAPIGETKIWEFPTAPAKHLLKIGQIVNRADYPDLWALASPIAITDAAWATDKTKFSSGNGTTTFRIPDWRDYFIRGAGVSRAVGTSQQDALQGHIHAKAGGYGTPGSAYNDPTFWSQVNGQAVAAQLYTGSPYTDGTNGTPRTAAETRPVNVAVNYIIRALA